MKLKYQFAVRDVLGNWAAVAVGNDARIYHNVISMNETGKDIFTYIQQGLSEDEIVAKMLEEYEVSEEQVRTETQALIQKLKDEGLLAE